MKCGIVDNMKGVLRTARVPTAQMDAFSVLTQICADHLIGYKPTQEAAKAFEYISSSSYFFVGAGSRINYLNSDPASRCHRTIHWYDLQIVPPCH